MRIVVTGGREYANAETVVRVLDGLRPSAIAQGGARGADALAKAWADAVGVPCSTYPADWKTYGRKGGSIRNRRMLEEFLPDLLVAFPGGRGTADCKRHARSLGVRVLEVE